MKICAIINEVVECIITLDLRAGLRRKLERHRGKRKEPNSMLMRRLL
jgi:hypothetical protein